MSILAIDFGRQRIGLAIAENETAPAYPLGTVKRSSNVRDVEQIADQIEERGVVHLVVGLPLNMDGSEGSSARAARSFGERLATHLGLPVDYADERLTSFEARERLSKQGSLRGRKAAVNAIAATLILEEWLATHRNPS